MDKVHVKQYHRHRINTQQTNFSNNNQHHTQPTQIINHPNTQQKEEEREHYPDKHHWKPQTNQRDKNPNVHDIPERYTNTTKNEQQTKGDHALIVCETGWNGPQDQMLYRYLRNTRYSRIVHVERAHARIWTVKWLRHYIPIWTNRWC